MCSSNVVAGFLACLILPAVHALSGNVQVIYPEVEVVTQTNRLKRDTDEHNLLEIVRLGNWYVHLKAGNLMVAPQVGSEWVSADGNTTTTALPRCDYRTGVVRGLESSSVAAMTLCERQIIGYVNIAGVPHFLQPMNETTGAHMLYTSEIREKRSTYASHPQWLFNLTGDTIDIDDNRKFNLSEDATEAGDEELFRGTDDDGSNEPKLDIYVAGSNSSDTSRPQFVPEWHMKQLDDDEMGYFFDTAWSPTRTVTRKSSNSNLPTKWLEIAIAIDYTLITFHGKSKVEQYVLALMNIVSAIYQDPSLEANLKLVITRMLLYENKKQSVVRPGNAKRSLGNVNNWNEVLHKSLKPDEPRHDLAVWLTRLDIGGPSGYAPVSGVCDPKRSCSLNRDEGLTSAFIIAHEMAHILGLNHDGDKKSNNTCDDEDGSIMAPMVSATFNKFLWSECSKNEFQKVSDKWTCLSNSPNGEDEIELNATLQNLFSMDEQCRMEFGDGYTMCRAFDIIEPCSHLWCGHKKSPLVCKTKKGPPLEGTECGFGKWCVNGYCEEVRQWQWGNRAPIVLNPQDGGWSDWGPWGTCSRTCGTGVKFRARKCNNPEPSYGGKPCEGKTEEWQICNEKECPQLEDLRAQQCKIMTKLLNFEHTDRGRQTWLPYESENYEFKCKLICVSQETKELYMTEEFLVDGTPCSYENSEYICVQGKCEIVGCDGQLQSSKLKDSCGVCGGNNSECTFVASRTQKQLKREVSRMTVVPRMAREIKVEANVTANKSIDPLVAFIIKNRRKKKYTITIPNLTIHSEIIEGTKFYYRKHGSRHNIWAKGPVLAEMIILAYASLSEIESGLNVSLSSGYVIYKNALNPSKRYIWIMGGWGPCSVSCGGGRRQKTTACWDDQNKKLVRRKFCSLMEKPLLETEKCNTFGCNFEWIAGEWEPCSTTCGSFGVQHRELYCVPKYVLNKMLFHNNGAILSNPWKFMVNPKKCSQFTPSDVKSCNRMPCPVHRTYSEWSQCSTSCGKGISTRTSVCLPPENEILYTCGNETALQIKECSGFPRRSNPLCKRKKNKCKRDLSKYCSVSYFARYCKIKGFRKICCKFCQSQI